MDLSPSQFLCLIGALWLIGGLRFLWCRRVTRQRVEEMESRLRRRLSSEDGQLLLAIASLREGGKPCGCGKCLRCRMRHEAAARANQREIEQGRVERA